MTDKPRIEHNLSARRSERDHVLAYLRMEMNQHKSPLELARDIERGHHIGTKRIKGHNGGPLKPLQN